MHKSRDAISFVKLITDLPITGLTTILRFLCLGLLLYCVHGDFTVLGCQQA